MPPISFPIKLWNLIDICPNELIRWSDDGTQVLVNEKRFKELVERYPSFLRQPTLSSLRRLFAVYEFGAEDRDLERTGWICYSHPYFVRGQPDLLELFVLSHQTKRYNARKANANIDDWKGPKKTRRCSAEEFVAETDSKDDLQPICSSSLFQLTLCVGLDIDSNADEQSPLVINKQHCLQVHSPSAYCSIVIETQPADVNGNDLSFCAQELEESDSEAWMSRMNENEEWFGLKDQPLAVPVSGDSTHRDVVNHAALTYTNLLQMHHYDDMH